MNDSSMKHQFSKISILILDPNKQFFDRIYVLVRLKEKNYFFTTYNRHRIYISKTFKSRFKYI